MEETGIGSAERTVTLTSREMEIIIRVLFSEFCQLAGQCIGKQDDAKELQKECEEIDALLDKLMAHELDVDIEFEEE